MSTRQLLAFLIVLAMPAWRAEGHQPPEDRRESSVGLPAKIDQLVLPGSELEVKPVDDRKLPVVLRIVATYPHGTSFRYDLVYYGLDPGTFDLKDYLRRKDGSSTADLPAVRVTIKPLLPPGQIEPHPLEIAKSPWLGGYWALVLAIAAAWAVGLLAIILGGRRGKGKGPSQTASPLTLADRLRPLVEQGIAGKLTHEQCAELERSLLAFWRRKLHLQENTPADAIKIMRRHPDAGPLLDQLEIWLHRPGPSGNVDVTALLTPYQNLPPDALVGQDSDPVHLSGQDRNPVLRRPQ